MPPKQALEPGSVVGGDPHRAVEAEASGSPPSKHVLGVRVREQATTDVESQDAALKDRRQSPRTLGVQVSGGPESQGAVVAYLLPDEEPIGDGEMEVRVRIQGRAEAVQEGDGAQPGFRALPTERLSSAFVVTAREAAHQWWGNLVAAGRGPGAEHLVEGMAPYAALLLVEQVLGEAAARAYRLDIEDSYLRGRRAGAERPVGRAVESDPGSRAVTFDRGAWVQWMLHDVIGREAAIAGLRDFVDVWAGSSELPVLEHMLPYRRRQARDPAAFDRFVEMWFFDVTLPEFVLEDVRAVRQGEGWALGFAVTNRGSGEVDVDVGARTGSRMDTTRVRVAPGRPVRVHLVLDERPDEVIVDPRVRLLQQGRGRARAQVPR